MDVTLKVVHWGALVIGALTKPLRNAYPTELTLLTINSGKLVYLLKTALLNRC